MNLPWLGWKKTKYCIICFVLLLVAEGVCVYQIILYCMVYMILTPALGSCSFISCWYWTTNHKTSVEHKLQVIFQVLHCNNPPSSIYGNTLTTTKKKYHTVTLPSAITSANIPLLHMTKPAITVFTLPRMNDPNRVRPAVPESLKTAAAAWQHVQFSSRLTSFLFYVRCPVSWSSGFKPEKEEWKGRRGWEESKGLPWFEAPCIFPSEGLRWLPSRWFTGPWRSRFVLLPETALDLSSRHTFRHTKSISASLLIWYHLNLSFLPKIGI